MRRLTLPLALALPALLWTGCADQAPPLDPEGTQPLAARGGPHVVQVAPPTGDVATDRASILAAAAQVREGGTILFAPGTYLIGNPTPNSNDYLHIAVPRITLLGHPAGTTIRGCNDPAEIGFGSCHGLLLTGGFQTVRNFTFEYLGHAVLMGRRPTSEEVHVGGYRVEGNEFRVTVRSVSMIGAWPQPAIIRNNSFINSLIAVMVSGSTAHVMDNEITAPDPERVPVLGQPWAGIVMLDLHGASCEHNVAAGNRIDAYENGILVEGSVPERGCRHNVVRDNTITNSREYEAFFPAWGIGVGDYSEEGGLVAHNLVQGNRVLGSEGQGIVIFAGERNRIVNNTVTSVTRTEQFPDWLGEGNGTGVWVSTGSRENQILNNTFAAVESYEVVLEGDYNHVATRSRSDVVRDLGVGNRVTGPGSVINFAAPAMRTFSAEPAGAGRAEVVRRLRQRTDAW